MYSSNIDAILARQLHQYTHNPSENLLVVCLCAQWCGTCRDYQHTIQDLSESNQDCLFVWIDIEACADVSEIYDVENFPSIALFSAQGEPYFLGTILPHKQHLERLIQTTKTQITQQQKTRLTSNDASIAQTIYRILTAPK